MTTNGFHPLKRIMAGLHQGECVRAERDTTTGLWAIEVKLREVGNTDLLEHNPHGKWHTIGDKFETLRLGRFAAQLLIQGSHLFIRGHKISDNIGTYSVPGQIAAWSEKYYQMVRDAQSDD